MKVLVACERFGIVREEFRRQGHDAWSCDLAESAIPGQHIKGNVLSQLRQKWDLIIAHPPCRYLANSGVHLLHKEPGRVAKMEEGARFFKRFLSAKCPRVCVENPVLHGYAISIIGRKPDQYIQPYEFGHPESKRTGLWLKGLPPLMLTRVLTKPKCGYWNNQTPSGQNKLGPSDNRPMLRAKTYVGIARAMAQQWG